jgi:hypothetical protein
MSDEEKRVTKLVTCVVCGQQQMLVEWLGDWACTECKQEHAYNPIYAVKLSIAQVDALRQQKGLAIISLLGKKVRALGLLYSSEGDVIFAGQEATVTEEALEQDGSRAYTLVRFGTVRIRGVARSCFEVLP